MKSHHEWWIGLPIYFSTERHHSCLLLVVVRLIRWEAPVKARIIPVQNVWWPATPDGPNGQSSNTLALYWRSDVPPTVGNSCNLSTKSGRVKGLKPKFRGVRGLFINVMSATDETWRVFWAVSSFKFFCGAAYAAWLSCNSASRFDGFGFWYPPCL